MLKRLLLFLLLSTTSFLLSAQEGEVMVYGVVKDSIGNPIQDVNIYLSGDKKTGTSTDKIGYYQIKLPARIKHELVFTYLKKVRKIAQIPPLLPYETYKVDVVLSMDFRLDPIDIVEKRRPESPNMIKIDPRVVQLSPTTGNAVESMIKTLPGVSSNTELSSSYSVRGGNFDENLVYINDVEIYRPFLVRSGQQEGLSIINGDLVEEIRFSAGGFEARYGDKMASVLDITYKQPREFHGSVAGGFLGGSAHIEGSSKNRLFTYLAGVRYHTTQYLLNSLDVQGDYRPNFSDFQAYFTYDLSDKTELSYLTYYGKNYFLLKPESRITDFGTPNLVLRLRIFFEGKEVMQYQNFLNAVTLTHDVSPRTQIKFIASAYQTLETENFDILGQYWLDEVDTDPNSETFKDSKLNLGVGSFLNHGRNKLDALITNFRHIGFHSFKNGNQLQWGFKVQHESIKDELKEWNLIDSSGYSLPRSFFGTGDLEMDHFASSSINLQSNRYTAFVQNRFTFGDSLYAYLTAGVRAGYWDFNNEMIWSPRVQFSWEPNRRYNQRQILGGNPELKTNYRLKASTGFYYQPPFYREFRDRAGNINREIKSQKSWHAVAGTDIYLNLFGRPFKWTTEVYYKYFTDLIPYDIEDVRIRYFAENSARGYAMGLDMQLNGEFIKNLPSWASISFLETKEDIDGDFYVQVDENTGDTSIVQHGFIRRPTDQRLNFGLFFQDFLPRVPTFKVFVNFLYGTSLPFGPPQSAKFRNQLNMDSYKRVDVGFSKLFEGGKVKAGVWERIDKLWVSVEVFNILGVRNTISHVWVRDIGNNQWAVPNYLTSRRFNLKVKVEF